MAFWGKASITGLSLLLGGLLRPQGSFLIFIRCIRLLGFRGSEGTLTEGNDLIRANNWKTSQDFVTLPMCVLCLAVSRELLGWQLSGAPLPSSVQALASLVPCHVSLFIVGEKKPKLVLVRSLDLFNRLVVISFFFFFFFLFPNPETLWIKAAE